MQLLLALLSLLGITVGAPVTETASITPTMAISPSPVPQKTVEVSGTSYGYAVIGPIDSVKVTLFSNLPDKRTSNELKDLHTCTSLTSGGFYDTDDQPIGLFEVNDGVIHSASANTLFNGYVWTTTTGIPGIGVTLPDQSLKFALQTGPTLINKGNRRTLELTTDQNARRIVVGVTAKQLLVFIAVFADSSQFSGPQLVNLPAIIAAVNNQENLQIVDAINLDGGNHSAFYAPDTVLSELSPIGSIFCMR